MNVVVDVHLYLFICLNVNVIGQIALEKSN